MRKRGLLWPVVVMSLVLAGGSSAASAASAESDGLWTTNDTPTNVAADGLDGRVNDTGSVELGVRFETDQPIYVVGVRFYQHYAGSYTATIWKSDGTALASAVDQETGTGWQTATFDGPVAVDPGSTFIASYYAPEGKYAFDNDYFTSPRTVGPVTALAGANGVFRYPSGFPQDSFRSTNYWVTPVWVPKYSLTGFSQPVDMGESVFNTVKGGSTVPLKFEVFDLGTEVTDTSVVKSFTSQQITCPNGDAVSESPIDIVTTGGTSLRYDVDGGQFLQTWQTPRKPGSCYQVTVTLQDGSNLMANVKLR